MNSFLFVMLMALTALVGVAVVLVLVGLLTRSRAASDQGGKDGWAGGSWEVEVVSGPVLLGPGTLHVAHGNVTFEQAGGIPGWWFPCRALALRRTPSTAPDRDRLQLHGPGGPIGLTVRGDRPAAAQLVRALRSHGVHTVD